GATAAKLVATTTFTSDAVAFAAGKPIELVGADALLKLLRGVQTSGNIVAFSATDERDHLAPECPRCGSVMMLRQVKRGANAGEQFWGCPIFPKCRGERIIRRAPNAATWLGSSRYKLKVTLRPTLPRQDRPHR